MFPSPTIECFIWKSFLATSISSRIRIRYLSPFHRHCLATPHDVINFRIVKDGTTKKTHKIFLILLRLRYRVVIFFCLLFICVLILNALRMCSLQHCCWAFSSHTILIPILKRRHSDKREATWRLWRRSSNIRWKGHSKCFPMAILWWDKKKSWLASEWIRVCMCVRAWCAQKLHRHVNELGEFSSIMLMPFKEKFLYTYLLLVHQKWNLYFIDSIVIDPMYGSCICSDCIELAK